MRKKNRRIVGWCLLIAMILSFSISAFAEEMPCSLTVRLEDEQKNGIDGVKVQICRVADAEQKLLPQFEGSGISVTGLLSGTDKQDAKKVAEYVAEKNLSTLELSTRSGMVFFDDLSEGLWLVYTEDLRYTFNPYVILLPYTAEGKTTYDAVSAPKMEEKQQDHQRINVVKKWEDEGNAAGKRPEQVTVRLIKDELEIASVSLSESNGWSHLFENLPEDGVYRVEEQAVDHYTPQYSGDEINGFIITNTYQPDRLPQTGQYWWPIAILTIAGAAMILLGVLELRGRKHEKK